jgi:PAS domain-containing protein
MATYPGLPIGLLQLDQHLRVVEADEVFCGLFGVAPGAVVGSTLDDLVSDRDRRGAHALASRLNCYAGGIIDLLIVLTIAGRDRYVRLRVIGRDGGYLAYVEVSLDDDDLGHQLAVARQRWNSIFRRSEEGIVILDRDSLIVEHNERFLEIMQFRTSHGIALSEGALAGKPLNGLLLGAELDRLGAALSDGSPVKLRAPLGRRVLEFRGGPMSIPVGGRIGSFLIVRDVTEQQQVEQRDALINADLREAEEFQSSILSAAPAPPGLTIDSLYRPVERVGGDVYDVSVLPDGTLRAFIADATGHGIKAALSTMLIKNEYDSVKDQGGSPALTLAMLNDRLAGAHGKLSVTMSAAVIDLAPDHQGLAYGCAGHPPPLLHRDGAIHELEFGGPLIGVVRNMVYPEWSVALGAWRSISLVTDGISEARNPEGHFFTDARLWRAIEEAHQRGRPITSIIWARLEDFVGTRPLHDDVTIVAVSRAVE